MKLTLAQCTEIAADARARVADLSEHARDCDLNYLDHINPALDLVGSPLRLHVLADADLLSTERLAQTIYRSQR